MEKDHIRMKVFGELARLSPQLREMVDRTDEISQHYQGFQANICLNYGGRDEIIHAARRYARDYAEGKVQGELSEEQFGGYLYSAGIPDRTCSSAPAGRCAYPTSCCGSAPMRSSTFTDVLWPDFTPEELDKAIAEFNRRDRRYGGVKNP